MPAYDAIVVGGGPAGSTCAWALRNAGADVLVIDRARFPRDKLCAGWVTPQVLRDLRLSPAEYRDTGLVIQDLRSFRTGIIGGGTVETRYPDAVSFAIRRCEFDTFLLRRTGAPVSEGTPLDDLERVRDSWIVNGSLRTPLLIGAGGHFCPVARRLGPPVRERLVVAKEIELPLDGTEPSSLTPGIVEILFSRDLDGYGWVLRKENYVNVGLGRRTAVRFAQHLREFVEYLIASRRVPAGATDWQRWHGHAYLLAPPPRRAVFDGVLLVGDAAGLAYAESGEGIGPAVRSALLAAETIIAAGGRVTADDLAPYAERVSATYPPPGLAGGVTAFVPKFVARAALSLPGVARFVLDRWFLRAQEHAASA